MEFNFLPPMLGAPASQLSITRTAVDRLQPGRVHVLVIEDDDVLLDPIRDLLEEEGFSVTTHGCVDGAHDLVRDTGVQIVLLDLHLAGGDSGWSVLDHLTLDPKTQHVPVVLWSADHDALESHRPVLLAEHGVYTLSKPFDIDALLGLIGDALRRPRLPMDGACARSSKSSSLALRPRGV